MLRGAFSSGSSAPRLRANKVVVEPLAGASSAVFAFFPPKKYLPVLLYRHCGRSCNPKTFAVQMKLIPRSGVHSDYEVANRPGPLLSPSLERLAEFRIRSTAGG